MITTRLEDEIDNLIKYYDKFHKYKDDLLMDEQDYEDLIRELDRGLSYE